MSPPDRAARGAHRPEPRRRGGPFHLGSLQRRLLLAAFVLVTAALVVAGIAIGLVLHRFVRGQLDSRLDSQIVALAAGLERGPGDRLALGPTLDGPPFDRDRSGWYWQVRQGSTTLRSASLEGRDLAVPARPRPGRDSGEPEPADGTGPWGESLILRILVLPEGPGGPVTLAAAAPAAALRGPVREAGGTLALILGVLGFCLLAGVTAQVRLGLRPLERLRGDLAAVRAGRHSRVPGRQPSEIRPLVVELNALLDENEANLARARTHVANLAHGLKTPLATLTMALSDPGRDPDGALSGLVAGMDRRVRHHLRRARAAALGGGARTRSAVAGHLVDLRATFAKLYADKGIGIALEVPASLGVACDGEDLDEMLGNLIDNACQWCRAEVRVGASLADGAVVVTVEDDGPGLAPAAAAAALQRGRRLDETVPGHGFGLSITTELAELYGGSLRLGPAPLGGLCATLRLPA